MVYVITSAFILLDLLNGLVKALKNKTYTSTIMREGLFHKCGSLLCIAFGGLVDYAQLYLDLGTTVPVAVSVCIYIVLMEIGSTIENVCEINPGIMPDKLKEFFHKLSEK